MSRKHKKKRDNNKAKNDRHWVRNGKSGKSDKKINNRKQRKEVKSETDKRIEDDD
ncbi:MAG: hypothetical protein JKY33_10690 [Bacteroidia bacterium]|nr:hypothetical protein [Bacteroidia bacterium]